MNSSKRQQSFSSYSQEDYNDPHPSEQDKFSEYEQHAQTKLDRSSIIKPPSPKVQNRRRYSYGPTLQPQSLHHLRRCNYFKGAGSPYGIGAFESIALEEYEKCYLTGLSKYYKSNSYVPKREASQGVSVSSSIDKSKNVDRSEYWNGQKFDYLTEKQIDPSLVEEMRSRKRNALNKNYERNLNSGLIVNKKQIKQRDGDSVIQTVKMNATQKVSTALNRSNEYIRIEEDLSNSKNYSEAKNVAKDRNNIKVKVNAQPLAEKPVKLNTQANSKGQQKDEKFLKINLNSTQISMEKDFSSLLTEKSQLAQENASLRQSLNQKNAEIQRITRQRIKDNDEYTRQIQKLKSLFEIQRNSLLKQHEEELSIYKQVRKEAIKNELVKEEEERLGLIIHKNRIQNELKKVSQQCLALKDQLNAKTSKLVSLEQKISMMETQGQSENRNSSNGFGKLSNKDRNAGFKQAEKAQKAEKTEKGERTEKGEDLCQGWKENFVSVFKNMVRKLVVESERWSDKKVVIIGWKMVKIMIERAVKLGIKIPEVVDDEKMRDCSILSQGTRKREESKSAGKSKNVKESKNVEINCMKESSKPIRS